MLFGRLWFGNRRGQHAADAEAHVNLGNALFEQGTLEEAIADTAIAKFTEPIRKGLDAGDLDTDIAKFTEPIRLQPDGADAYLHRAQPIWTSMIWTAQLPTSAKRSALSRPLRRRTRPEACAYDIQGQTEKAITDFQRFDELSSPEAIRQLFKKHIPEIADGVVEIKGVARIGGRRSKIAVYTPNPRIDALGSCVGRDGTRIKNIVDELGGERIDIIRWNESLQVLIPNAMQPAEIDEVMLCHLLGRAIVLVRDDQLSLAIGRWGQNVRLASKLVRWDIEIMTAEELDEVIDKAVKAFEKIEVVDTELAERLVEQGILSYDDLSVLEIADLVNTVEGLTEEQAVEIVARAAVLAEAQTEELLRRKGAGAVQEEPSAVEQQPAGADAQYNQGGGRQTPHGDPARARLRRGPLQPRQGPVSPREAGRGGIFLDDQGKLKEAAAELHAAAHGNLGIALAGQGKLEEAIAEYRDGDPAQARRRRGPLQPRHRPERPGEAGGGDRRIPHGDPAQARLRRGPRQPRRRPADQGKLEEAIAEFRTAIRLKPDFAEAHYNLGIALAGQGKLEEAIAEYRAAIRLKPDDAEAHNNLGVALDGQGKLEEAIAEYREAIRLKPDFAEAHSNLGDALADQGKLEEAIAEYRTAIRLKPDDAEAHYNLGIALEARGSWRRRSPNTARRSGSSPTTPWPTTTSASPWQTRGSWRRRSPNSARRSGSSPTSPRPTTTSATP